MNYYDKKYLTSVIFYEDRKNKGKMNNNVFVCRDGKNIFFNFNNENDRIRYMKNYCEMDENLQSLPKILETEDTVLNGKRYIKYIFTKDKENDGYCLNDWCDFSFAYEGGTHEEEKKCDNHENISNDEFIRELNKLLNK